MRLMIVEDEEILRRLIVHKVLNTGLQVEIAAEAANGRIAYELLPSAKPDLVITDIRMPEMDGLALIEQAKQAFPDLPFVVVSGYDDFKYAQRAMHYGVTDYLLKPVDDVELAESLSGMIERISRERQQSEAIRLLSQAQRASQETVRQQMLTRYIQSGEKAEPQLVRRDEQLSRLQDIKCRFLSVVFVLEPFELPRGSFRSGDDSLIRFAVQNVISDRLASEGCSGFLFHHAVHENELVYVLGMDTREEEEEISGILSKVIDEVRNYLDLEVTIAFGSMVTKLEELQTSYRQAQAAMRDKLLHGPRRVYRQKPAARPDERNTCLSDEEEKTILEWLAGGKTDTIGTWIEERLEKLANDPESVYPQLEWLCTDLFVLFRKHLIGVTDAPEWLIGEMDDLASWLQGLSQWQDAAVHLKRYCVNIAGNRPLHRQESDEWMHAIKRHIDRHFHESLSLQTISEQFHIHPNYFSRKFKETFSLSFIDYLTSKRMQMAQQLLLDPEIRIYEVAERVGYEDPNYFSTLFRREIGETPKQYREKRMRT